jgi:hypothetical protein
MCSRAASSGKDNLTGTLPRVGGQGDPAMRLPELLRAINMVAQTGATAGDCEALAREVYRYADMVGWATGAIDPRGLLLERLVALQDDLGVHHAQTRDAAVAVLHDSLTDLGRAIARHDDDLDPGTAGEGAGEDPW